MRHATIRHHRLAKRVPAGVIKRAYRHSIRKMKSHPIPSSLGLLTLGAGLLSGVYVFLKAKRH